MLSDEYRSQLEQLHTEKSDFGTTSGMYAPLIKGIIKKFRPHDMLDYGAGKQTLKTALGIEEGYHAYDPAIQEIADVPNPHDLVVCTDVLEHIEPLYLQRVLDDLQRVTQKVGFLAIHTGKALNHLPDGRNAHLIQEPARWWMHFILKRWEIEAMERGEHGFWVIVTPLKD